MLTSLIATILGMIGGVIPEVMKEVRETRNASREIELLKVQAQLQLEAAKATADGKLREVEAGVYAQEMAATREYLGKLWESQAKPTGIAWIDAFNAVLRPTCVSMIMLLYMLVAVPFTLAIIERAYEGSIDWTAAGTLIFGSMVGESFMAIFGFLFGYRSTAKLAPRIA
jgi:hypothetical protein